MFGVKTRVPKILFRVEARLGMYENPRATQKLANKTRPFVGNWLNTLLNAVVQQDPRRTFFMFIVPNMLYAQDTMVFTTVFL